MAATFSPTQSGRPEIQPPKPKPFPIFLVLAAGGFAVAGATGYLSRRMKTK